MDDNTEYTVKTTLEQLGAMPVPVKGTLLVGKGIARWDSGYSRTGYDRTWLAPAVYNGDHCWVRSDSWQADLGHSAEGTTETIVPIEEGIRLLLESGQIEALWRHSGGQ